MTLFAPITVFLVCAIPKGLFRLDLFKWARLELLTSCAFEMVGINGGAYECWEPHVFRVFNSLSAWGSAKQRRLSASVSLRPIYRHERWELNRYFVSSYSSRLPSFSRILVPAHRMVITLHATNPTPALVTAGPLVTIGFALSLIWGTSIFSHSMVRLHFLTMIRHTNLNGTTHNNDLENGIFLA